MRDDLGDRMKEYEAVTDIRLIKKLPVIMRLDGKAFHSFCIGFNKPWDVRLHDAMIKTTIMLCQEIQGAKLGYTQSDEITILITDFEHIQTSAWYDYKLRKMLSVSAAVATEAFVKHVSVEIPEKRSKPMRFDSRANNLPNSAEVVNNFRWRMLDAIRNSKLALGQSLFSHNILQGLSAKEVAAKALLDHKIDWEGFSPAQKWGTIVRKIKRGFESPTGEEYMRSYWEADENTPGIDGLKDYIMANSNLDKLKEHIY